jgi:hypothetical protein
MNAMSTAARVLTEGMVVGQMPACVVAIEDRRLEEGDHPLSHVFVADR